MDSVKRMDDRFGAFVDELPDWRESEQMELDLWPLAVPARSGGPDRVELNEAADWPYGGEVIITTPETVFIVVLDEGQTFRVRRRAVGRWAERRWLISDAQGNEVVGPPERAIDAEPFAVRDMVHSWWHTKCALGQAGMTRASLRAKILSQDN